MFSGRLLRFFASLRSLSSHHMKAENIRFCLHICALLSSQPVWSSGPRQVLAAASEGFLFGDLWRLGHLLPMAPASADP